jgi:alpha-glucosidase (family GH31 glycosyl hydrolase)
VLVKESYGHRSYVGRVWAGSCYFMDFMHPEAARVWHGMLKLLYHQVPFSGLWIDMNEPTSFEIEERYTHWAADEMGGEL